MFRVLYIRYARESNKKMKRNAKSVVTVAEIQNNGPDTSCSRVHDEEGDF